MDGRVERYAFNFYPSFFEQGKKISTGGGAFYDEERRKRTKRYAITREGEEGAVTLTLREKSTHLCRKKVGR